MSPKVDKSKLYSLKLAFDCTNNVDEYEVFILGLEALKYLGAKRISVCGYSEMIINYIKICIKLNILGWGPIGILS